MAERDKKKILIIGAGRSSTALIDYLLKNAEEYAWELIICDVEEFSILDKIKESPYAQGIQIDITQRETRKVLIQSADLVVSMLPAYMHHLIAYDCLTYHKNLVTASYWTEELLKLDTELKEKGLFFMGELGLDPGIDHMSAMCKIDEIRRLGGKITAFHSHTGGLIAPESDNNPWRYKITWNPRNVVLAGNGTARFLQGGKPRLIPYHRLFTNFRKVEVSNLGAFESYPNRDSLKYQEIYGLRNAQDVYRGTLRYPGFCDAWNIIVQMGLTDDEVIIENQDNMSYQDWTTTFFSNQKEISSSVVELIQNGDIHRIIDQLKWLGLFDEKPIPLRKATSAQILEDLLIRKLRLSPNDKDLIVMQHEFEYELEGQKHYLISSMHFKGENSTNTAMTQLVGLPLAIFIKNILLGKIALYGIHIPTHPEVYNLILDELKQFGVHFDEQIIDN